MFVEQEVAGKNPNLGYAYLVRLIEEGYLNTVFTTNFDDLVNEAFFQFSQTRPIVCAHDSSIASVSVTSKRPKVIKLHGDYLFDDIKSTVRETESLEDNTRRKFIEFCRDFGLIIVGYGGYDRSIMDVLHYLLRSDDYFKHGIYWCLRPGDQPSDDLLKLLWRDRVYFVTIDGFDELMAALHNDLVGGSLPIDTGVVTNKPKTIIRGFCENLFLKDSQSDVIKRDLERLMRQSEREELFSVLRDARDEKGDKDVPSEVLSEREIVLLFEIKQNLATGEFSAARTRIRDELEKKPSKRLKDELSDLRIRVEELAGDLSAAVAAVDSMIAEDPQEAENYIRKTLLVMQHSERLSILDAAESADPENYRVFSRRADCYIDAYDAGTSSERADIISKIKESFDKSIRFEPGLDNPSWRSAISFYETSSLPKEVFKAELDSIVARNNELGTRRTVTLRARLARWSRYKEDWSSPEAEKLLKDISDARLSVSKSIKPYYEWLELDAYRKLGKKEDLSRRLSELAMNTDLSNTREYLRRKSEFLLKFNGDLHGAIGALKQAMEVETIRSDVLTAAHLMGLANDSIGIAELSIKHASKLQPIDRITIKRAELAARGEYESALAQLRASFSLRTVGAGDKLEEVHDLLLLTRYAEASLIGKEVLDKMEWNKGEAGEHIINFELAQLRLGKGVTKRRLGDLVEATNSDHVKACAYYLLGDIQKAKDLIASLMRDDREERFVIPKWALFQDQKGKQFVEEVVQSVG